MYIHMSNKTVLKEKIWKFWNIDKYYGSNYR